MLGDFFTQRTHCVRNLRRRQIIQLRNNGQHRSGVSRQPYSTRCYRSRPSVASGNAMCKYADDIYVIIPASNVDSREAELRSVESCMHWALDDSLRLNRRPTYSETAEITFHNRRYKQSRQLPPVIPGIPGIARAEAVKVLRVTVTCSLSVSVHVQNILNSCSQKMYAFKTQRVLGLPTAIRSIPFLNQSFCQHNVCCQC
jgi:hypothetical protein